MSWFLIAMGKYATFSGRARRSEFWYFTLFAQVIIPFVFLLLVFLSGMIAGLSGANESSAVSSDQFIWGPIAGLYSLAIFVPSIAVSVRRLHDIDASGWWFLLSFVPFANIALLVMYVLDGTAGPNRFGPNPKETDAQAQGVCAL